MKFIVALFIIKSELAKHEAFPYREEVLEFVVVPAGIAFASRAITIRSIARFEGTSIFYNGFVFLNILVISIGRVYNWDSTKFLTILIISALLGWLIADAANYMQEINRKNTHENRR